MDLESVIQRILDQRKDLTREKLLQLIEKKKFDAQGLLSDEGAARLVAQDLVVKINGKNFSEIKIFNIVSNLNDVTLISRVIAQWPLQEFNKQNGTIGKLVRLVLADNTGTVRCILWDHKAEQITREGNLQGKLIRLAHCYTRVNRLGFLELNGGERCEITILTQDLNTESLEVSNFFKELSDIKSSDNEVNVIGIIDTEPKILTYSKDQNEGTLLKVTIKDHKGSINIVAWNDKVQDLINIKRGEILQVIGGKIKSDLSGYPEVHIGSNSLVNILKEKPPHFKLGILQLLSIAKLKPDSKGCILLAKVLNLGKVKEFIRSNGQPSKYGTLLISDTTGLVRLFLWDEKVELMNTIHEGDTILIEDFQIKERQGEIFISIGKLGNLIINPLIAESETPIYSSQALFGKIDDFSRPIIIEGKLIKDAELKTIQVGNGENVKVTTILLDDGTGKARLSLWRELADRFYNLKAGNKIRVMGTQPRSKILGELILSSNDLTIIRVIDSRNQQQDKGDLISHYI